MLTQRFAAYRTEGVRRATSDEEVILGVESTKRSAGGRSLGRRGTRQYKGGEAEEQQQMGVRGGEPNKNSLIWLGTLRQRRWLRGAHDIAALALEGRSRASILLLGVAYSWAWAVAIKPPPLPFCWRKASSIHHNTTIVHEGHINCQRYDTECFR
ncbi:hypothetical protein Syun_026476 [Stephania yunnanensis]|uniref:Uncharacterized protein n=1 Tax=Stephania yunnanensis TaxID=152371 RepID=A0AAP0EUC4_9MAGN